MFAHIAETGSIIEAFCKRNEALRSSKVPRAMRAFVAGVQTVLSEVDKNKEQPLLRVFATGANMGLLSTTVPFSRPGHSAVLRGGSM